MKVLRLLFQEMRPVVFLLFAYLVRSYQYNLNMGYFRLQIYVNHLNPEQLKHYSKTYYNM